MHDSLKTRDQLLEEVTALRTRLEEPEATLSAIQSGQVDAFVVLEAAGERVYTLATAELLHQLQVITDSLPVLVAYLDREGRFRFISRLYEPWFGRPLHEIAGRTIAEVLGEAAWASVREPIDAALSGRQVAVEQWLDFPETGRRYVHITLVPHVHAGQIQGLVSFIQDTSERRRAEQALRLLADSGKLLAESPGGEGMLAGAGRLAVPALADWCAFELGEEGGGSRRVVSVHADPGCRPGQVAPCSRLDVPLLAHGRMLGTWSFVYAESGRSHGQEDREVAQELARRVAVMLDNSRLYRELEAANRAKDRFLAMLSHELRTPLTPVLAMASRLLADAGLPAGLRAGLAMIRRNVELEARLIDDLLDLTRISRGKLDLHCEPTDLRQVIEQALETCDESKLAARRLVRDFDAEEHFVWGDPSRLVQVFWNLLSNALKFTPPDGTIRLRSYLGESAGAGAEAGPRQLVVEISDSGVGVDAVALPHIFDAFDQGEAGTARRFGGLGLGLAISRAIVEMHGGSLTALSAGRERGTTLAVRLPLPAAGFGVGRAADGAHGAHGADVAAIAAIGHAAGAAGAADSVADAAPRGARPESPVGSALRILVVEDHADSAQALADLLHAAGHRVTLAGTIAAALAAAASEVPDLLISDLGLPDGDGDDLMRALAGRYPGLPGIALSGYGMEADVARSREAGFSVHLVKPVTFEGLQAAIQRLVAAGSPRE
ncbi:MAG TPA: ATP-binding protein [Thermoanaerobaculia bacterium]